LGAWIVSDYRDTRLLDIEQLLMFGWLYLFVLYFFGVKYVMKIGLLNNASHREFTKYVQAHGLISPFAKFLVYLGSALFIVLIVYASLRLFVL